jgi:hypothetical protein
MYTQGRIITKQESWDFCRIYYFPEIVSFHSIRLSENVSGAVINSRLFITSIPVLLECPLHTAICCIVKPVPLTAYYRQILRDSAYITAFSCSFISSPWNSQHKRRVEYCQRNESTGNSLGILGKAHAFVFASLVFVWRGRGSYISSRS